MQTRREAGGHEHAGRSGKSEEDRDSRDRQGSIGLEHEGASLMIKAKAQAGSRDDDKAGVVHGKEGRVAHGKTET